MTKTARVVVRARAPRRLPGKVPMDRGALGSLDGAKPPRGVQLLNDDVFGRSASAEPRVLLVGTAPTEAAVQTAVRDGKYHAAAVVYPASVTLDAALAALRAKYGPSETSSISGQQRWTLAGKGVSVVATASASKAVSTSAASSARSHRKHAPAKAAHSGAPQASAMPRS